LSITIRDDLAVKQLGDAIGPQEIYTPDGRLIGQFIPSRRPGLSFPELGITDAEFERKLDDPNAVWYTPEQVMARLREIDRSSS
jgi:hypothetical protein